MSAITIVQQLYDLSKDPDHREHIVKDQGCLAVLVMLLGSNESEDEMVTLCLKTLELLSQNENNKQPMLKEPGLVSTLKKFQEKEQHQSIINKILSTIDNSQQQKSINETTRINDENNTVNSENINNNNVKKSTTFSMLLGEKLPIKDIGNTPMKPSSTNNNNNTPAIDPSLIKTVLLHVKGMNNESTKKQLEECFLRTKGVISFMIDLNTCHATVRTALSSDEIKMVIRNHVGLSSSLIVDGQEEQDTTPDYLPEPQNFGNNQQKRWGWGSIISFGQEQKQTKDNNAWGWNSFSKALFG
ncbi:hypothetical protein DICPUDRAFT_47938 [Dictyostelium purpureum]|uniref:Armadillo repeat-containing protein 1 n=1 Tax=Dictyostelium purpureum TaxID=5786 RepID=F0ZM16_DICPU|nr:uncharacterized protein DICPUDRAFT_47938 [Dictyostelium purpureum]EGC35034.1 hypothetical protein DICPUDRAFT_47938 [Dictyostelium purpureum]|eukprot:XP_003288462.1 hypothetical protein DICPUDRAFT_47938 [Dictyostelium purpureum]